MARIDKSETGYYSRMNKTGALRSAKTLKNGDFTIGTTVAIDINGFIFNILAERSGGDANENCMCSGVACFR